MSRFATRFRFCLARGNTVMQTHCTRARKEAAVWFRRKHQGIAARQGARTARIVGSLVTCTVVLSCAPGLARGEDHSSTLEDVGLPPNLAAASVFQPYLERMVRMSPTFRSQCRRLAAAPSVKVQLRLEDPQRRPSFRARTVVERDQGVVVAAHVFLLPSPDAVELIAHEIEHVLEQLDGVDLQAQVGSGNVWKREDGAFETRRATEAGLRVPREMRERSKASRNSR